jgi:hypothetical protein
MVDLIRAGLMKKERRRQRSVRKSSGLAERPTRRREKHLLVFDRHNLEPDSVTARTGCRYSRGNRRLPVRKRRGLIRDAGKVAAGATRSPAQHGQPRLTEDGRARRGVAINAIAARNICLCLSGEALPSAWHNVIVSARVAFPVSAGLTQPQSNKREQSGRQSVGNEFDLISIPGRGSHLII